MIRKKVLPRRFAIFISCVVCCSTLVFCQSSPNTGSPTSQPTDTAQPPQLSTRDATAEQSIAAANSFDQVIDPSIEREHFFMAQMKQLHPLVETYLQNLKQDKELDAPVPASDVYFLGRLDMSQGAGDSALPLPSSAGFRYRAQRDTTQL